MTVSTKLIGLLRAKRTGETARKGPRSFLERLLPRRMTGAERGR